MCVDFEQENIWLQNRNSRMSNDNHRIDIIQYDRKEAVIFIKAVSRLSYGKNKLKPYSAKVGITVMAKFQNQDIKNFDLLIW